MRQYAGNRIGLAIVGALLLLAGGYGWLRGRGELPGQPSRTKVLPERIAEAIAEQPWALWLVALVMVLLALVTLRWLVICLGWGRRGFRSGTGTAMLCVGLKDVEGLSRAGVRVVGDGARLRIAVTCPSTADVGAMAGKLDRDIVGRIRREVCDDEVGTIVRLHVRR